MKRLLFALSVAAVVSPALAADVGVSIGVGDPGFYGRIDIGDAPRPRVIYPRPITVPVDPVYLHVPREHSRDWRNHCSEYDACGKPSYFVDDFWYNDVYVPHHREHHHERYEGHGR